MDPSFAAAQPIEPRSDEDSSFDFDIQSSTASLSASILDYRTIHGRTYHSEKAGNAEYWCVPACTCLFFHCASR